MNKHQLEGVLDELYVRVEWHDRRAGALRYLGDARAERRQIIGMVEDVAWLMRRNTVGPVLGQEVIAWLDRAQGLLGTRMIANAIAHLWKARGLMHAYNRVRGDVFPLEKLTKQIDRLRAERRSAYHVVGANPYAFKEGVEIALTELDAPNNPLAALRALEAVHKLTEKWAQVLPSCSRLLDGGTWSEYVHATDDPREAWQLVREAANEHAEDYPEGVIALRLAEWALGEGTREAFRSEWIEQ